MSEKIDASLGGLHHKLTDIHEALAGAHAAAIDLRNRTPEPEKKGDLSEVVARCVIADDSVVIALKRLLAHMPQANGDASHTPIGGGPDT